MKIAVSIPCYNEAETIGSVVSAFRRQLPEADIYCIDNDSSDDTARLAVEAGAIVIPEHNRGKGNAVRTIFRSIDADILIMVDGDDTYPAEAVHDLIKPIAEGKADMVVGDRLSNKSYAEQNTRLLHSFGNNMFRGLANVLFGGSVKDVLSGYRAFSRLFVSTMPVLSKGFEIESELTFHSLDKGFRIEEVPVVYRDRPEGSTSKLRTFRDGWRILATILRIFKDYRPFVFFSAISLFLLLLSIAFGIPPISDYIADKYVYHVPMFILSVGLFVASLLMMVCGLILDTVVRHNRVAYEIEMNHYSKDQSRVPV